MPRGLKLGAKSSGAKSSDGGSQSESSHGVPRHVAVIMDGNGRWAKAQGRERLEGHRAGAATVQRIIEACAERGVEYLTLFSFSTENWKRAKSEVMGLMGLFAEKLKEELRDGTMHKNGVRMSSIGDVARLPLAVRTLLREVEQRTAQNSKLNVFLALSYGAREEIVLAARALAEEVKNGKLKSSEISEELFSKKLFTADIPDPDLLIRTGGEMRVSNFLLWQIAYSEIIVVPDYWPDFSKELFNRCLEQYSSRERRFGMTSEQVQASALPSSPSLESR